jgi:hydrogenase nickel incorporation protein HypB
MTRNIHRRDPLDRLLDDLLAPVEDRLGPLRAHRVGHDHDHGDGGDHGEGGDHDDVLAAFREQARNLHERLVHDRGVFVVELVGSTGSGKTRLVERLVERAPDDETIGAVVGDVAGDDDARRLRELGLDVANVNTGKECHLDPGLLEDGLAELDLAALDTLYVENVGNMVCPADFPLGAQVRLVVVSTTEGDDVVRKHPLLFQASDAAVVNKVDVADAVNADVDAMVDDLERVDPDLDTFRTSAEHGDGLDALAAYLDHRREAGHGHGDHARDATRQDALDGGASPPDAGGGHAHDHD